MNSRRINKIAEKVDAMPNPQITDNVMNINKHGFDDIDTVKAPPRLNKQAFEHINGQGCKPSFIADIVQIACKNSEASPEAVALNIVAFFSALIGREKITYQWADSFIDARPSILIVGKSGSNKGISEHLVGQIFTGAQELMKHKSDFMPLDIRQGGLNSGEGLIHSLQDVTELENVNGVIDKRALIIEPEFSKVLAVSNRDGATLSGTLRNFHDGTDQRNTTKSSPCKCTRPHLVMMAHITKEELLKQVKPTDIANGFMNRFMVVNVIQDKDVANPTPAPNDLVNVMIKQLVEIIEFINKRQTMTESECFKTKFDEIYPILRHPNGTLSKQQLLARTPKYARMFSMIFALMEKQTIITGEHLNASLLYIRYWWDSISYIFENDLQVVEYEKTKKLSQKVLEAITKIHGKSQSSICTRTNIARAFHSKLSKNELDAALSILLDGVEPKIKQSIGRSVNGGVAPKLYEPA